MAFQCLGWCPLYLGCCIWDWGGAFCILDGLSGIVDSEFDILEDILLLGVGIWCFRGYFFVFLMVIMQFGMFI